MSSRFPQADMSRLKRTSISQRSGGLNVGDLAQPPANGWKVSDLVHRMPRTPAGEALQQAVDALVSAARHGRAALLCTGDEAIRAGHGPILIDLIRRGVVTAVSTSGACAMHDLEIALFGQTGEPPENGLLSGGRGMTQETADFLNKAALEGSKLELGFGEALGRALLAADCPHRGVSLFASAYELRVPICVHVSLGADAPHMHSTADGAAIGDTSLRDFRILAQAVGGIGNGGAILSIGATPALGDVLLNALTVARNLGADISGSSCISIGCATGASPLPRDAAALLEEAGCSQTALAGGCDFLLPVLAAAVAARLHDETEAEGGTQSGDATPGDAHTCEQKGSE